MISEFMLVNRAMMLLLESESQERYAKCAMTDVAEAIRFAGACANAIDYRYMQAERFMEESVLWEFA